MSSVRGPARPGKRPRSSSTIVARLVDGEGGLGEIGDAIGVLGLDLARLVEVLDQADRLGRLARGPLDLVVARVADQHDRVAGPAEPPGLGVDLADQGAGGVDDLEVAAPRGLADRGRDAVRREHHPGALGNLLDLVDEDRAAPLQVAHHVGVVNDLAADVERRPVALQRALDDVGSPAPRRRRTRAGSASTTRRSPVASLHWLSAAETRAQSPVGAERPGDGGDRAVQARGRGCRAPCARPPTGGPRSRARARPTPCRRRWRRSPPGARAPRRRRCGGPRRSARCGRAGRRGAASTRRARSRRTRPLVGAADLRGDDDVARLELGRQPAGEAGERHHVRRRRGRAAPQPGERPAGRRRCGSRSRPGAPRRTAWASNRIGAAHHEPARRALRLTRSPPRAGRPGSPLSASRAAARPLRTAPSIVAGQPVAVHAPASASPGIPVRWLGRRAPTPGAARKVASCSRTTSKRSTRASRARGQELAERRQETLPQLVATQLRLRARRPTARPRGAGRRSARSLRCGRTATGPASGCRRRGRSQSRAGRRRHGGSRSARSRAARGATGLRARRPGARPAARV